VARARGSSQPPQSLRSASARARREDANGFAHEQVAQIQRARILSAMFDVATEHGAANMSVADVVQRSGVSRRTFYEFFSDRDDCFLAAFEHALAVAGERVLPAYRSQRKWRDQIRAGLIAFLSFLDEEPVIGRLLIVESLSGGAQTLERRDQVLARVAEAIDEGRGETANAASLPALTADGLVGGALSVIHARLARPDGQPLLDLASQLTSMIVLPYLGPAAARRELERPVESLRRALAGTDEQPLVRPLVDPFKDAGMRLTYRTVRVLLAIAENQDASNRLIGANAGMTDQGQISKLLGRLQRLQLIENAGLGPGQGAPNAWVLTASGQQMVKSIRTHTEGHRPGDHLR
jgi:AcrR family transcriptional regulator